MDIAQLLKPNVSEEMAKDLVMRLYGMEVTSIKRMKSYDDQNFHIQVEQERNNPHLKCSSQHGYTLKITNTQKSSIPGHFHSMHTAMTHLNGKGLSTPIPVKNLQGTTWTFERVPLLNEDNSSYPQYCGVHLLTFVPGSPISTISCTKDVLYQWGQLLARLHMAAEDLICPELNDKYIFWSLEHVPDIQVHMEILTEDKMELVKSVLNRYPEEVTQNLPKLPKGIIHGDFNENNVLVQKTNADSNDKLYSVDGILDFEDIQHGTYVWDIGVMLAYTLLEYQGLDALEGPGHALAGYLSLRSLNSLELSLLKMCIECRLCQSLVLGAFSYSQDISNTYLLESARTGWAKLEQICTAKKEDLLQKWKDIEISYK